MKLDFNPFGRKKDNGLVKQALQVIALLTGCSVILSCFCVLVLSHEAIAENQQDIVALGLNAPNYVGKLVESTFRALGYILGTLILSLLVVCLTAMNLLPRYQEAKEIGQAKAQLLLSPPKQGDSTQDLIKLMVALSNLNSNQNKELGALFEKMGSSFEDQPALPLTPILEGIRYCGKPHKMIYGPSGSGKSTLTRHLVLDAIKQGSSILVLDPHSVPGDWPDGTRVIGGGERFDDIALAIEALHIESSKRFDDASTGKMKYGQMGRLLVVVSELPAVLFDRKKTARRLASIIIRVRKVNIQMVLDGQSKTVKSLGIEGQGDIRDSLAFVTCSYDGRKHHVKIDDEDYLPAGPFVGWSNHRAKTPDIMALNRLGTIAGQFPDIRELPGTDKQNNTHNDSELPELVGTDKEDPTVGKGELSFTVQEVFGVSTNLSKDEAKKAVRDSWEGMTKVKQMTDEQRMQNIIKWFPKLSKTAISESLPIRKKRAMQLYDAVTKGSEVVL